MPDFQWTVLKPLGEGAAGSVWLARTPEGRTVALKVLSADQSANRAFFKEEAGLLVRLSHPSLVSVLGFSSESRPVFGEERGPCYWMEWVEGRSLFEAARGADPSEVLAWLRDGLEGLSYLETQRIVHGDLSPGNVLIDREGRLKILDFGESCLGGRSREASRATLDYMAPERIDGRALPASDLFSLGSLFYEAIARIHPRSSARNLRERFSLPPPPLESAAPDFSRKEPLAARVIERMTAPGLSVRFPHASSVLAALDGGEGAFSLPVAPYHSAVMLGAGRAFEKIQKALEAIGKRSRVLLLHGTSGVGKTRFLKETAFLAQVRGLKVEEVTIEACVAGLPPGLAVLRDLAGLPLDRLAFLLTLRRHGLPDKGTLLVLEWNDDALTAPTRGFFEDLRRWPGSEEIHLRGLDPTDAETLVVDALGPVGKSARLSSEEIRSIHRRAGGNPRLLLEIVDALRGGAELPEVLSRLSILDSRLRSLTESQKRTLAALALTNAPVDSGRLRRVLDADDLIFDLRELEQRDLIEKDERTGGYVPASGALRDDVVKGTPPAEVSALHASWLEALRNRPYPDPQRLHHAIALADRSEIAQGLLATVEFLSERGGKSEALGFLKSGKASIENPALLSKALRAEINILNDLGRYEEALSVCDAWYGLNADDESPGLRTVKYWLVTGMNHQNLGRHDEAVRRFRTCLDHALTCEDPEAGAYRVRAQTLLGVEDARRGDEVSALKAFERALEFPEARGRRRAEIARHRASVLARLGDWAAARALLEESRSLYREEGFREGEFATFLQEGILSVGQGDVDRAQVGYREAQVIAESLDDPLPLASVWHNRSVLERKRGRLSEALDLSAQSERVFRLLNARGDWAESLRNAVILEASVGRFAKAARLLEGLKALAASTPGLSGIQDLSGDAEGHLKELKDGILSPLDEGVPPPESRTGHWNRELVLRAFKREGDGEAVAALLRDYERDLPPELHVRFVDRADVRALSQPKPKTRERKMENRTDIPKRLLDLSRDLVSKNDMGHVLRRLMDAALELTGTENGFLLLESKGANDGPIPGFTVAAARNLRQEDLSHLEYALSLSAVRDAMRTGEAVVTDNAAQDPRYREAKSVRLSGLKSILALPVLGPKGPQGVFYLDNRFREGLFGDEVLGWMEVFAAIAAVALQKGRLIEDLKKSNAKLSRQVEVQAGDAQVMRRELEDARRLLKSRYSDVIGRSPKMMEVLSLVDRITDSKVPVWIYGESGTGKESIARALHFNSGRQAKPFVTENCSALPESLLESELFGHKKGSFTHATSDKKGILQYADGGTIFLDEIADMSVALQSKLLRFLQEGDVRPIGSAQVVKVDVRVVSASNKDLSRLVSEGRFREDLFYRLNGVTVALPPLRERMEDLPLLIEHFLKRIAEREKKPPVSMSPRAMEIFLKYPWPGNVRELQNTLETAALFAEKGEIVTASLKFKAAFFGGDKRDGAVEPLKPAERAEAKLIEVLTAIRDHCFHKGEAAKALGISRRNLYTRLARYGVASDLKTIKLAIDKYLGPS